MAKKKANHKPVEKTLKKSAPVFRHFKKKKSIIDYERLEILAKTGMSDNKISKVLGIDKKIFIFNKKEDPKVRQILNDARKDIENNKHKGGAPTAYEPKYCQMMIDYFDIEPYRIAKQDVFNKKGELTGSIEVQVVNDLPLFSKFATNIKVCRDTLDEWKNVHPEFERAYKLCKDMQATNLLTSGLKGLYNPSYAGLVSKNWLNMKDKKDVTTNNQPIKANTYVVPAFNNTFTEPDDDPDEGNG